MQIRLENISKFYYSDTSVTLALQKINLRFPDTGFVAITGESGSGKSTLVSVISGMIPFEEGELYFGDKAMSACDDSDLEECRKNNIGFVFQEYNLIDEYTVYDNVETAIIIRGIRKQNIRSFANEIIKKVGLSEFVNQRAGSLSSGQKQRLAIARALAKEADIIVADEPTGNLDSENSIKIMELFAEIAKDKLVIMVTHNYELAQPYVNRQIRLFEGKIVSDTQLKQIEEVSEKNEEIVELKKQRSSYIALKYMLKNLYRQPLRSMLIAFFVMVTAVVSYVFMGQIISNFDDTHTKIYDTDVFAYENDKRIIVKKDDGSILNEKDIEKLSSMKYVENIDTYDLCNDIRYANIPGEDYYETYYESDFHYYDDMIIGGLSEATIQRFVSFNESAPAKYMRSASCITEEDLESGRLPEARNEIVMYIDESIDSMRSQKIFFLNENLWGKEYYESNFEVVGILKEKTSQVYFSESFCDMITAGYKQGEIRLQGAWCVVSENYKYSDYFYPLINEDMEGYDVSLSDYYSVNYTPDVGNAHMMCEFFSKRNSIALLSTSKLLLSGERESLIYENTVVGETTNKIEPSFAYMSEEFFYELYEYGSHQVSLYIEHYAYTDKVIEALEKAGYDAISSYRVACIEPDEARVNNRVRLLLISFVILIVMAMLEVAIVSLFFKLRRKFYSVLHFMGMELGTIKKINFYEINLYAIISILLTLLGVWVIGLFGWVPWLIEFGFYMEPIHYIIYIVYNFVLAWLVAIIFNSYLEEKINVRKNK